MKGRTLVLASNNPGKAREVDAILAPVGIRIRRIRDLAPGFDVVEDGETFAANAAKKALAAFAATGEATLADDSGLCVEALGGAPGVRSARYGGPDLSDHDRAERLLRELAEVAAPRRAWFQCALAAVLPGSWLRAPDVHATHPDLPAGHRLVFAEGRLEGVIGFSPRGGGGFGYDPVFEADGSDGATLAEVGPAEKNQVSHRGRALAEFFEALTPIDQ